MNKKRYEIVFHTSGSDMEEKAIEKVVSLALNLVAISNNEALTQGWKLRATMKEKI